MAQCEHRRIVFTMLVPTYVTVNRATGQVERVRVNDEAASIWYADAELTAVSPSEASTPALTVEEADPVCLDCDASVPREVALHALRVAAGADDWPAWEFGA